MLATIGVQPSEVSNILNLAKSSLSQSASKSNPSIQKNQSRDGDLLSDDDLSFGEYDDISDVIKRQYITHSEAIGEALKTQRILLL